MGCEWKFVKSKTLFILIVCLINNFVRAFMWLRAFDINVSNLKTC